MLTGLDSDLKEIVIETGLGGGDCGYDFRRGVDYIVYASKKPDGGWTYRNLHADATGGKGCRRS